MEETLEVGGSLALAGQRAFGTSVGKILRKDLRTPP